PGVFASMAFEGRLRGPVGETISITFRDNQDQTQELDLTLARSSDPLFEAANLPPMPVSIRFQQLDSGVGYFAFSAFLDPARLMNEFQNAINQSRELDGLVIDLRGNLGGIIALCNGLGGWLLTETPSAELGRLTMRDTEIKLVMNRRAQPLSRPVAVLIDERSISSAEILAGGLQDTGVARVFGSTSAGMSLPSVVQLLPNGDSFQYAISNYTSASGRELEKNGVEPDEPTPLTRDALVAGIDPALSAAITWIQAQKHAPDHD
ncbi:MAG: S41 family peptidase, partial [Phycisphaerales bacterium]